MQILVQDDMTAKRKKGQSNGGSKKGSEFIVGSYKRYLTEGKATIGKHRDDYDDRIVVHGDLDALESANAIAKKKGWSSCLWRTVFSPTVSDNEKLLKMSDDELREEYNKMAREWLAMFIPHRDIDDISWYAEIHKPKLGTDKINPQTGLSEPRKIHMHLAISRTDMVTGNKLECAGSNKSMATFLTALQSEICHRFNYEDPTLYVSDDVYEEESLNKKLDDLLNQDSLKNHVYNALSKHKPRTASDMRKQLLALEIDGKRVVKNVEFIYTDSKKNTTTPYLKLDLFSRDNTKVKRITLKQSAFVQAMLPMILSEKKRIDSDRKAGEKLSKREVSRRFLTSSVELDWSQSNIDSLHQYIASTKVSVSALTRNGRLAIMNDHERRRKYIAKQVMQRRQKESIDYDHKLQEYVKQRNILNKRWFAEFQEDREWRNSFGQKFDEMSRNQRQFWVVYRAEVSKDVVDATTFFKNKYDENSNVILNKSIALKALEFENRIVVKQFSKIKEEDRAKAVDILIATALAKGWKLEEIRAKGNDVEFINAIEEAKARLIAERDAGKQIVINKNGTSVLRAPLHTPPNDYKVPVASGIASMQQENARKIDDALESQQSFKLIKSKLEYIDLEAIVVAYNLDIDMRDVVCVPFFNKKNERELRFRIAGRSRTIIDVLAKDGGMGIEKASEVLKHYMSLRDSEYRQSYTARNANLYSRETNNVLLSDEEMLTNAANLLRQQYGLVGQPHDVQQLQRMKVAHQDAFMLELVNQIARDRATQNGGVFDEFTFKSNHPKLDSINDALKVKSQKLQSAIRRSENELKAKKGYKAPTPFDVMAALKPQHRL